MAEKIKMAPDDKENNKENGNLQTNEGDSNENAPRKPFLLSCALPADLVGLVLSQLDWPEALSLGGVSRTWENAAQCYHPDTPRSPCLLHLHALGPDTHQILSVLEKRCSIIRRRELWKKKCCGIYKCWLVLRCPSSNEMSLLHVVTGNSIRLPPLCVEGSVNVVLAAAPTSPDCLLLAGWTNGEERGILSWRPGEAEWTTEEEEFVPWVNKMNGYVSYEGKFYMLHGFNLFVVDLVRPVKCREVMQRVLPFDTWGAESWCLSAYLVECGGDILVVFVTKAEFRFDCFVPPRAVHVFRIDLLNKSLVPVPSLLSHALFLGYKQSVSAAVGSTGCKGNCVYISDPYDKVAWRLFHMGDRSITDGPNLGSANDPKSTLWIPPGLE